MSASHSVQGKEAPYYYVPADSGHPVRTAVALLLMGLGAAGWINGVSWAKWSVLVGFIALIVVLYYWFGDAIQESEAGMNSKRIDGSYRWGMSWFIFSEVMFFAAFFGALWYVRTITTPWLGDMDHRLMLWPDFQAVWPNFGPVSYTHLDVYKRQLPERVGRGRHGDRRPGGGVDRPHPHVADHLRIPVERLGTIRLLGQFPHLCLLYTSRCV